ncbi:MULTISPECIES: hypothetical protein [Methylobacteriaceae]|uniref:hypothetical protein n=1 Tax=Methylobacteriaceae TaxID=119045 RepID=UPI002F35CBC6
MRIREGGEGIGKDTRTPEFLQGASRRIGIAAQPARERGEGAREGAVEVGLRDGAQGGNRLTRGRSGPHRAAGIAHDYRTGFDHCNTWGSGERSR